MKFLSPTVIFSMAIAASSQAALLTSFSDNFNRADGGLGSNYTQETGNAYAIVSNIVVLANSNNPPNTTTLNVGTLPTATDFGNGYSFSASLDVLYVSNSATQLSGLLLNYQDPNNWVTIALRGDDNNNLQVRGHFGSGDLQNYGGLTPLASNLVDGTWYTLSVNSGTAGVYNIGLALQGQSPYATTTIDTGGMTLTGGYMGFLGAEGGANQYDNLSVNVVPEPGVAVLLGTGLLGLVGVRRLIRSRS